MTQIRRAQPRDAEAIAELHVATWRTTYAGILPDAMLLGMSPSAEGRNWLRLIATTDHQFAVHVAEAEDGQLRGYGSAGPARPSGLPFAGEVYTLYVHPDHQERGIGERLLAHLFYELKGRSLMSAVIWVLAPNPARFFYEAMGGVRIGDRDEELWGTTLKELAYVWTELNACLAVGRPGIDREIV